MENPNADQVSPVSFAHEARTAAVNEACGSSEEAAHCNITSLCPFCQNLATQIEKRLMRAFVAGIKFAGEKGAGVPS